LRLLLEIRSLARQYASLADERLEDFVLDCREDGGSARSIAENLDVSSTTVQNWTKSARRRRGK